MWRQVTTMWRQVLQVRPGQDGSNAEVRPALVSGTMTAMALIRTGTRTPRPAPNGNPRAKSPSFKFV